MLFLILCAVAAVIASRMPWVQRLDQRVLGPAGVAIALWLWTALFAAAMTGSLLRQVWALAVVFGAMSCWVGYGAYKRSLLGRSGA